MDTIFALATPEGRSGVAVVRISGGDALAAGRLIAGSLPLHRRSALRVLKNAAGKHLDEALVLTFEKPNSFTGEDVVELHLHGSVAVIRAVLSELSSMDGLRMADPGEFTKRALENERLDLTQVEGLSDLLEAETEAQRQQAQKTLSGQFGKKIESWRASLIRAAALLEATIDFADEDVPVDVSPEVRDLLTGVLGDLNAEIDGVATAERIRSGFEVAIVGPPNVGKSTLLNVLARKDAAIVSDVPGTTRDVIEVRTEIDGLLVTFIDTAGLRETDDVVEKIGVERAQKRADLADIRIVLAEDLDEVEFEISDDDIHLLPKGDLFPGRPNAISGKTGLGVDALVSKISARLREQRDLVGLATHERHRIAMVEAETQLEIALGRIDLGPDVYDIASEDLRVSVRSLESLVGRIDVENLLDEIFASFCLGK